MNEEHDEYETSKTWAISSLPWCVIQGIKQISLDNSWTHATTLEQLLLVFQAQGESQNEL